MDLLKVMHLEMILLAVAVTVRSSKVLLFPAPMFKRSSITNMEKIAAILVEHGHEIHFLMDDWYDLPKFLKESGVELITFPRPTGDQYPPPTDFSVSLREGKRDTVASYYRGGMSGKYANTYINSMIDNCDSLMGSTKLLDQLIQEKYDLLLFVAYVNPCKRVLASFLHGIPTIEVFHVDGLLRLENRDYPLLLSYFPILTRYAPEMSFTERVNNFLFAFMVVGIIKSADWRVDGIANKHRIEIKQVHSLHLVFGGFPVEYPAPNTPDVVYMNGILISEPEPLEPDLDTFVHTSGGHGVVIVSFGTTIKEYGDYYRELFAEALSKIAQKVIWQYDETVPRKLGNNTRLMKWLPMTSLLAHPKTKVFITHCGINSAYESIYYGVPMLGLPVFFDQPSNCARFARHHGAGIELDLNTVTVDQLVSSLQEIISNPKYKENANSLGTLLRDQPISGKDLLLYWVDYVIRHKGVEHLKPYGSHLPWYQFYLIDVVGFLLLMLAIFVVFSICACKLLFKKYTDGFVRKIKKE